jgi:transposase
MRVHANAKLGPAGRLALVRLVGEGYSLRTAADESAVSVATAHRWWHRWQDASAEDRRSGAWLGDRSSRPHRQPRRTDAELEARICAVRRATGWGPRLVAGATGRPHSTVWRVLARHGLSRRAAGDRGAPNRYEWPCPGDLLHMDVCRYARFRRPGHRATGDRSQRDRHWMHPETRVGDDYAHAIVDDHSRLAYVELHDDERAATVTGFLERALAFFAAHGITAKRVMTDGCCFYVNSKLPVGVLQWIVMVRVGRAGVLAGMVVSGSGWSRCQTRRARWRLRQRMASRRVLPSACRRAR